MGLQSELAQQTHSGARIAIRLAGFGADHVWRFAKRALPYVCKQTRTRKLLKTPFFKCVSKINQNLYAKMYDKFILSFSSGK